MGKMKKKIIRTVGYLVLWYLRKDRYYTYKGIKILVRNGVFHPAFFFSSKLLLHEVLKQNVANKKVLELGAGSGLISFHLASKKAIVTATDISQMAIDGLKENKDNLGLEMTIIKSNLFDDIPLQSFDYIIINPPYYPKKPTNDAEKAWYCGENFEYFEKLFYQLEPYTHPQSVVLMSLSEDCDFQKIASIAIKYNLLFKEYINKMTLWERNYIYKIVSK